LSSTAFYPPSRDSVSLVCLFFFLVSFSGGLLFFLVLIVFLPPFFGYHFLFPPLSLGRIFFLAFCPPPLFFLFTFPVLTFYLSHSFFPLCPFFLRLFLPPLVVLFLPVCSLKGSLFGMVGQAPPQLFLCWRLFFLPDTCFLCHLFFLSFFPIVPCPAEPLVVMPPPRDPWAFF